MLDATGFIAGYDVILKQYDLLSAFSMSYRKPRVNDVALACSPSEELPPFPETVRKRLTRKCSWCVEPWSGLLATSYYEAREVISQHGRAEALCQQAEPIVVEEPAPGETETEDEGHLFLTGPQEKERFLLEEERIRRIATCLSHHRQEREMKL